MQKGKDKLSLYFNKVIAVLEEQKSTDFLEKILTIRDDMFSIIDDFSDETEEKWLDVEERMIDLAKEFQKISSIRSLSTICVSFILLRENRMFERELLKVLNKSEDSVWDYEDLRPAILTVLKEYRKEVKATEDTAFLERFDDLKDMIKKVISNDNTTDTKWKYYQLMKEEARSNFWEGNKYVKFLSKACYVFIDFKLYEEVKTRLSALTRCDEKEKERE